MAEFVSSELYGETWGSRFLRLRTAYGLSQSRLATIVGLSAPMVSQLVSGHRVKISNPAVFARVVRLEELASDPGVASGDPIAIGRVLEDVTSATPTLTTTQVQASPQRDHTVAWLRTQASADVLALLADDADRHGARTIATALRDASRPTR
jgi:transcriptional regulator with XRE-family HTH domain